MKPSGLDEGRRWMAQAERDLDAAELLAGGKHFNLACFHAQQAAEKAVKAFLYAQGVEDPWGHSVGQLLEDARSFDVRFADVVHVGALLDKFYIPTRYPNGLPGGIPSSAYSEQEAQEAMHKAREILRAMAERMR